MGASLAFEAALNRYSRQNYVLLNYHVHIPQPDPMVNPSTLDRQKFYGVRSTPSYFIDGDQDGGGGSAESAGSIYERKVEPAIEKHLTMAPEAAIKLRATRAGDTVKVTAAVSTVKSKSDRLRLQIALVEDVVRYSGENGLRFHEAVVRSMAVAPATAKSAQAAGPTAGSDAAASGSTAPAAPPQGFALRPGRGGTFEYTFDLVKAEAEARAHLEDFETNTRKGAYTFRQKKHEIDRGNLSVVAFVQDEATKKILQAVHLKVPAATAER